MELTTSQLKVQEFIKQNVPEHIAGDKHIKVLLDVLAITYGDILDSDDMLKTLINVDNIPEEYLADLGELLGYEMDQTLSPQYQRLFMKQFLNSRKRRGTSLALKVVGASYSKDAQSFLESGIPNEIEVVEYGINDQNYVPGVREIWQPGTIAVTLLDGAQFVKDKLLATTPAGIKLNLNTRQQVDIDKQSVYKSKGSFKNITRNSYSAMYPLLSEVYNLPIEWIFGLTLQQINDKYKAEVGSEVTTVLEYLLTAGPIPNGGEIARYYSPARVTVPILAKSSAYQSERIVVSTSGVGSNVSSANTQSTTSYSASLTPTASSQVGFNETSKRVDAAVQVEAKSLYAEGQTTVASRLGVDNVVNRLVEYFNQRVDDIKVTPFVTEAEVTYSYR